MTNSVSEKLVFQRTRNRIIEVLELFSDVESFEVARSNLEFWEDWASSQSIEKFGLPIFSKDELAALSLVNAAWELAELDSLQSSKEWQSLSAVSKQAFQIFMQRGKFSESSENA